MPKTSKSEVYRAIQPLRRTMGRLSGLFRYATSASVLSVSGLPLAGATLCPDSPDHNRSIQTARRFRGHTWRRSTVHSLGTHRKLTEVLCTLSHPSRGTQSGSSHVNTRVVLDLNGCLLEFRHDLHYAAISVAHDVAVARCNGYPGNSATCASYPGAVTDRAH